MSYWQKDYQLKNGRFIILEILGEGGFGVTYLAKDEELKRYVVIKTLNEKAQREPRVEKLKKDFKTEAERLSQCYHHNIVKIYDIFDQEGLPCIVMEYILGETLADRLKRGVKQEEALDYIRQIGEALKTVHNRNMVHRDVKPNNIMIQDNTQEAVLIDFGISRELDCTRYTLSYSPGYAPLEQYDEFKPKDSYTDVYSLAATLYTVLTKETPESADDRKKEIKNHNTDPLIPPRQINRTISVQVNQAIMKGMELEPRNRPQTIQEWLHLLPNPQEQKVNNGRQAENNTTDLTLLGRTFFMGVAIWLLALTVSKFIENPELRFVLSFIFCVGLIFLAQYRLPPHEQKSYLFLSSVIPTLLIFLVVMFQIIPGVQLNNLTKLPISYCAFLTLITGLFALILIYIYILFTRNNEKNSYRQ
ncbi:serine/threonine protein kinase [Scytonema tolypothrichoides VB-61278]|nr:serine/threonine protein kinase [Scytonema tolypothrichoides VB-61278]